MTDFLSRRTSDFFGEKCSDFVVTNLMTFSTKISGKYRDFSRKTIGKPANFLK